MSKTIVIKKKDGSEEPLYIQKIQDCCRFACRGIEDVEPDLIAEEAATQLYNGVPSDKIYEVLMLVARTKIIDADPNYSYVAARFLMMKLYREAVGRSVKDTERDEVIRQTFKDNLQFMVEEGLLNPKLATEFDLDYLAFSCLQPSRDGLFEYPGIQTLYDRYFIHKDGRRLETPQAFFMRVAMGLCLNEESQVRSYWVKRIYDKISTFKFMPSTPTLFNSGTNHSQLASCYLTTLEDDLDGIFGTIHSQALLAKWAGGIAVDWTPIRAINSHIKGTNGPSQGIIPWMKIFNDMLVAVNQGSKRRGSGASYLESWHYEVEEFQELRKNTGDERRRCHDMNTANWIPDLFMERVENDDDWYLFSPDEAGDLHDAVGDDFKQKYLKYCELADMGAIKIFKKMKAKTLWKKMLLALLETGHPWITFKDTVNVRYSDKHKGVVHSSNLCCEYLRHTIASTLKRQRLIKVGEVACCTLSSPNLGAHVNNGVINKEELADTLEVEVRALDNSIDLNYYPIEEAENSHLQHRPVGLGLMGWADALHLLRIPFDSEEATKLADSIQEFISLHTIKNSVALAKERGAYPTYDGSEWSKGKLPIDTYNDWLEYKGSPFKAQETLPEWQGIRQDLAKYGIRNACTMAIAPNATISYVASCSECIAPYFSPVYTYTSLSGQLPIVNKHLVARLKELGKWNKKTAARLKTNDGDIHRMDLPEDLKAEYKTAFQIDQLRLIDQTAVRQKWIDMGQSLNIYYDGKSLKKVSEIYFYAWKQGLKTTYYLRTKAASSIEKVSSSNEVKIEEAGTPSKQESNHVKQCRIDNPGCESCQ